jgi:hypothetical protein
MDPDTPQVHIWSFREAPLEFQELFPGGRTDDWVAYAAAPAISTVESMLLRWRTVYPVRSAALADGGAVYLGTPRGAIDSIAAKAAAAGEPPSGQERRAAPRAPLECPMRYETHSELKQSGRGHTIDISSTGISFTAESPLLFSTKITLFVAWPVRIEGNVPVELRAVGKLARSEETMAAMQLESVRFWISDTAFEQSV